ncbi:MAG: tyrosine-type recombinase/integrase [Ruminococcus sp.]|nr:tyrosine-type recombinase/integrase [Ruminococcus sp.]
MNCEYASKVLNYKIWPDFTAHFQSETTKGTYQADITEIMRYFKKDFLEIEEEDAKKYYKELGSRVKEGKIQPATMAKKFRELHSFAAFISENKEVYGVKTSYQDVFYPFLKLVVKQEKYTRSIPASHMDQLLEAAREDRMAYAILVLLYRVGLSSVEIAELKRQDIAAFDNGVYIYVEKREEHLFLPEDVYLVIEKYLETVENNEWLFYNQRKNQLNLMYISRMMKKYCEKAEIPFYSAESVRNTCGVNLFAYGAKPEQVAQQMGITQIQVHRYRNLSYREKLQREASRLVRVKVEPPK